MKDVVNVVIAFLAVIGGVRTIIFCREEWLLITRGARRCGHISPGPKEDPPKGPPCHT